ncbi:MAG: heavy-metal-associated domain-containing protein [Planctomycetales bacterium]|nr:heavy-metal-associated domain-containing protein [Planctomycetales bacterium]
MMYRNSLPAFLLLLIVGCGQPSAPTGVGQQVIIGGGQATDVAFNTAGLPTVTFDVPAMHCEVMCVPKVRDTLARQVGVMDVKVDLESKTATVAVKKDLFNAEQAATALIDAEFPDSRVQAPQTGA